jgi:hypothetical protein
MRRREFIALFGGTAATWLIAARASVRLWDISYIAPYRSDKKAKRTYAGFRFDMNMTGVFALCAVLTPQVAASYGVRLNAIPEAYWGTWVPTADICEDADKSATVFSAKAYVTSAVNCMVEYVAETASPKGPI